jgi:3-deoxy-D-manno-octulosonic-acid transferase
MPVLHMYFIYSLLLGIAFILLLPRFLLDAFRHGKYVAGFSERLGSVSPLGINGRPVIWIHCVSVGETQAARPLVRGLKERFPEYSIAISTITVTGQNLARQVFKDEVEKIFYFPFDWRWMVRKTIKAINPAAILIMETELWPSFLRECKVRKIPVAIVNGRLSQQSFRRYRWIKNFMLRIFSSVSLAIMQTEADAERLRALGMEAEKTFVSGNMKFDAGTIPLNDPLTTEFRERFGLSAESPLILAASTHAPEEVVILNAFHQVITRQESKPRLIIAPRHPERFAGVADLLHASGLRWTSRTSPVDASDREADVVLLDSIGELPSIYSLASIVFVGGSIAKSGGHNIVEPAAAGASVITGPHTYNFQFIVETFVKAGAIIQLPPMTDSVAIVELENVLSELLTNPKRQQELGERAARLVNENRGATDRTLELLNSMLPEPATVVKSAKSFSAQHSPTA